MTTVASPSPRWMRLTAGFCAISFTISFVLASHAQALGNPVSKKYVAARPFSVPASAIKHKRIPPPASLRENLKSLTKAQIARLQAGKHAVSTNAFTLLDEVGRLNRFVPDIQVSAWKRQLRAPRLLTSA
jgi:hypothetical protein